LPGLAVLRGFASARRGRSVSRCGAPGRRAARGFSANALAGPALRRRSPEALCRDLRTDAIFHPAQLSMPMQPSVSTLFRRSRLPTRLLRSSGSPAPRRGRWREKMDRDTRGAPVTPRPRHARRIRDFHSSPPFAPESSSHAPWTTPHCLRASPVCSDLLGSMCSATHTHIQGHTQRQCVMI
jgi:hypothetical protein